MSEHDRDPEPAAALEQRLRADLRRLVAATPPEVRARLEDMARTAAKEPLAVRRPRAWRLALPIGVTAAAASALVLVMWRTAPAPAPPERPTATDDLALLLNVDNFDLLEQMEFYQWLDREPTLLDSAANPGAQRS